MLSDAEVCFVISQGFEPSEVFDSRGYSAKEGKERAKAAGSYIMLSTPCRAEGHRLRTRSGHCCECNRAALAFLQRHRAPGYVYIATCQEGRLTKIGSAINLAQRLTNLCAHKYGGFTDWSINHAEFFTERGKAESYLHNQFSPKRVESPYLKDGKTQIAAELYDMLPEAAIIALKALNSERAS